MSEEQNERTRAERVAERMEEEHHSLRGLLVEVNQTYDLFKLLPLLEELKTELREHFEQEESEGGFGAVVSDSAPHKANVVDHLFDEHVEFLQTMDGLQGKVEELLVGPVAEMRATIAGLCARIEAHEAKENELLSEALYTDIGGG
jgi:hemerythrin